MLEMREQIEGLIDKVEDQTLQTLLKYRYISGLRWEEIAVKMNYSYRSVCYLHIRALKMIKESSHYRKLLDLLLNMYTQINKIIEK